MSGGISISFVYFAFFSFEFDRLDWSVSGAKLVRIL
jgi:hypothetical protein